MLDDLALGEVGEPELTSKEFGRQQPLLLAAERRKPEAFQAGKLEEERDIVARLLVGQSRPSSVSTSLR